MVAITGVRTVLHETPLSRPLGDANNPSSQRNAMTQLAVFVDTDVGTSGISIAVPSCATHIQSLANAVLIGRDPRGVQGLWNAMVGFVFKAGNRGDNACAIDALDIALWDLKARLNNEPLWVTFGASSRLVKAYASGIDYPLSEQQLGDYYASMAAMGINAGKLKIGLDLEMDMKRIRIMRDALATSGKTPELILDVNEYWSPKQSIRYMHVIEAEFDITWLEEPARRWDVEGLKQVSNGIRAAVSSGENLQTVEDLAPLINSRAIDVLNLNKSFSGFSGAMRAAHLASAQEIPTSGMNCWGNAIAHLCASLDNHWMMEVLNAGESLIFSDVHPIVDGYIVLNDEPGLGYTIDLAKLEQYAVDQPSPTARPSPFGRRQGAAMFLVPPDGVLLTPDVEQYFKDQADRAPRVGQIPKL